MLSDLEITKITEEAEAIYPIYNVSDASDELVNAINNAARTAHISSVTAEREKAKALKAEIISEIESGITGKDPATEMDIAYHISIRAIKRHFANYNKSIQSINNGAL